jgi:hypothetical protein
MKQTLVRTFLDVNKKEERYLEGPDKDPWRTERMIYEF